MEYAVSDIHGCLKTFKKGIEEIIELKKSDILYILGDLVDRGPESKNVIEYIRQKIKEGYNILMLRGNHEEMMLQAFDSPTNFNIGLWMNNGAMTTLKSYNKHMTDPLEGIRSIDPGHIQLIRSLPFFIETDRYIFVHASLNTNADEPFLDTESMIWERECKNDFEKTNGKIIIHGHTPFPKEDFDLNYMIRERVINIDTGCVYDFPGLGYLTILKLGDKIKANHIRRVD